MTPMRSRLALTLVLLALLPLSGEAAIRFALESRLEGEHPLRFGGTGLIERSQSRIDFDSGTHPLFNASITMITREGGLITTVLDREDQSWFERAVTPSTRGIISTFYAPWQQQAERERVSLQPMGAEDCSGHPCRRYRMLISYRIAMRVGGEQTWADVDGVADLWLSRRHRNEALPFGLHFALKTGFPPVDESIERQLRGLGLPVRQDVTVTRTMEGGEPVTERLTVQLTAIEEGPAANPIEFQPPHGFRHREPRLTIPE